MLKIPYTALCKMRIQGASQIRFGLQYYVTSFILLVFVVGFFKLASPFKKLKFSARHYSVRIFAIVDPERHNQSPGAENRSLSLLYWKFFSKVSNHYLLKK